VQTEVDGKRGEAGSAANGSPDVAQAASEWEVILAFRRRRTEDPPHCVRSDGMEVCAILPLQVFLHDPRWSSSRTITS
jgi:hypothetical protein